jgi:hypothetical protein
MTCLVCIDKALLMFYWVRILLIVNLNIKTPVLLPKYT